jgi:ureidoacrylate peracid hydrolase
MKSPRILPSDDVDFPDVFSQSTPDHSPSVPPLEELSLTNSTEEVMSAKETFVPMSSGSDTAALSEAVLPGSHSRSSDTLHMSLKEQVRPGQSRRTQFPLVLSKVALLVIDIQEYLSHPSSKQDEEEHAFFYRTSLPRTVCNVEKLLKQIRQQRDSQSQGCEVIFTYLEALTPDCRDVSLDYKLSGPHLATLPTSAASPATFLNSITPLPKKGKGDILIPKTSCSVFMSTNIHYVLQNLHVEQLLVCGQLTDQCVESAVRDAADLGYFVTVIEDACAAQSEEGHQKGLAGMKGFSRLLSTEQALVELQNPIEDLFVTRSLEPAVVQQKAESPQAETVESSSHISIRSTLNWDAPPCNEETATTALLCALQFAGVKFLRYMTIDAFNSVRCKAVPLHHLSKSGRLSSQVSIAQVCFAGLPTYGDAVLEGTGLDARRVLRVQPDLSTLRILPYAPSSAVVLGTAWDSQNMISPLCTRGLLSRVVKTAENHGIEFVSKGCCACDVSTNCANMMCCFSVEYWCGD